MAPNQTSAPTQCVAEAAAVCPSSSITSLKYPRAGSEQPASIADKSASSSQYRWKVKWTNLTVLAFFQYAAYHSLHLQYTGQAMRATWFWGWLLGYFHAVGVTAGAHRLWCHRSYKAKWPLRVILMILQTLSFQGPIYLWVRDHRVHHKFTDTDADPYNSRRGFFFAHVGWLLIKKHPDVSTKGAGIDLSDLEQDPIVMFQKRHYIALALVTCFLLPPLVAAYFWGENFWTAFWICSLLRCMVGLHVTWLVNSYAHMYGTRPIDSSISSTNSAFVSNIIGEGWHNYHHVFPWDYRASELGTYWGNSTTAFIDLFAKIGWAYDLKTVSKETVEKRARRTGDGSHRCSDGRPGGYGVKAIEHQQEVWGWGDQDMSQEDIQGATIINKVD